MVLLYNLHIFFSLTYFPVTANRQAGSQEEESGPSLPVCPSLLLILIVCTSLGVAGGYLTLCHPRKKKKQLTTTQLTLKSLSAVELITVSAGRPIHVAQSQSVKGACECLGCFYDNVSWLSIHLFTSTSL